MNHYSFKKFQKGIGLPEVLVSMLLLGVSVVGFAALQVRALSSTNEAMFRTQAMAAAQEFSERMRLNPDASATYRNNWTTTAVAATYCETNTCTAIQMAQYDMRTMTELVAAILPNGQIAVLPCVNRTNLCVYVSWGDTTPTKGTATTDCSLDSDSYVTNASCVKLETSTL